MLNREDNELLTLTGPGTAMGDLLRRYWTPVVLSSELTPGGRVKRVKLLGERLIAYRTPSGRPGLIAEFCPHRSASLYFGRVEEAGMRCVYHGWKFGHDGRCMEMPSEPAESSFAAKVTTPAYPCTERGGWCGPTWARPNRRRYPIWSGRCSRRITCSPPSASRTATGSRRWRGHRLQPHLVPARAARSRRA
jgi:nitrite reductase/ring-hydroxylating ferredoxin subunit